MTRNDFQRYVEFVAKESIFADTPIGQVFRDYNRWQDREPIARALAASGKYTPAIRLMKTVVEALEDDHHLGNEEQYALALLDMGVWTWSHEENAKKALGYIDRAFALTEGWKESTILVCKGQVWFHRLTLLNALGCRDEAIDELEHKLELFQGEEPTLNSYIYWGLRFKAELETERGRWEEGCKILKEAAQILGPQELGANYMDRLEEIYQDVVNAPEETYEELLKATGKLYAAWRV